MTTLVDRMDARFTWKQVEEAILSISDQRITAAARFGVSAENGCRMARAQMADDVRRALEEMAARAALPKTPPTVPEREPGSRA